MSLLKSAAPITPKSISISIHLSSLLNCGVVAGGGDPYPAGRSADMKSNGVIANSGPNNHKIDTHNDISVFLIFWCDGG